MTYNVLVFKDLHSKVIDVLQENDFEVIIHEPNGKESLIQSVPKVHAIILRGYGLIDQEVIQHAPELRCIVRAGIGVSNIDVKAAEKRNIVVMNTPGCNSLSAAEYIFALLLNLSRRIITGHQRLFEGIWKRDDLWGNELAGKTLGIIGFGRVGRFLTTRAQAFDMKVISFSPNLTDETATNWGIENVPLSTLYSRSDYISIAFSVSKEDRGMISEDEFELMKTDVKLVNLSWTGLFDLEELAQAIRDGIVGGVALDPAGVRPDDKENPLYGLDQVIYTPHLGAHTIEAQKRCSLTAADQVIDYLTDRKITNQV